MNWFVNLAARIFGILAALFTAKKWGEAEAEKEVLEDNLEALKHDAEIAEDYRNIDLGTAINRMWEKVRKRNARNPRSKRYGTKRGRELNK